MRDLIVTLAAIAALLAAPAAGRPSDLVFDWGYLPVRNYYQTDANWDGTFRWTVS